MFYWMAIKYGLFGAVVVMIITSILLSRIKRKRTIVITVANLEDGSRKERRIQVDEANVESTLAKVRKGPNVLSVRLLPK